MFIIISIAYSFWMYILRLEIQTSKPIYSQFPYNLKYTPKDVWILTVKLKWIVKWTVMSMNKMWNFLSWRINNDHEILGKQCWSEAQSTFSKISTDSSNHWDLWFLRPMNLRIKRYYANDKACSFTDKTVSIRAACRGWMVPRAICLGDFVSYVTETCMVLNLIQWRFSNAGKHLLW